MMENKRDLDENILRRSQSVEFETTDSEKERKRFSDRSFVTCDIYLFPSTQIKMKEKRVKRRKIFFFKF